MKTLLNSISQVFIDSIKAFRTFPVTIGSALAFALVTMIRIQLDFPQQEPYDFLFNCLLWSFAFGSLFSLASITAAQSRINTKKSFITANLLAVLVIVLTFLTLYLFGKADGALYGMRYHTISVLSQARVGVGMLISMLAFIVLAGYPKDKSDFSSSLFMTHKAFFIALIYGLFIWGGTSGVAGAIEALLYTDMSSKVYLYIDTLSGFIAFIIFVGYFPDFRLGTDDEHREVAQKQPRFIEVLFGYILAPIVLALTVVLLIWAGKTIFSGMQASFIRLYSIATAYAVGGILLHMFLTHHEGSMAKFYRRVYPVAALAILAFEAWALFTQLAQYGLKTTEYYFTLVWILTVVSAILLLLKKSEAHVPIASLVCALAIFSVLPALGYQALPVTAQVNRLEKLLVSQGMLKGNELVPASSEPTKDVRESITDSINFLVYSREAKLPVWLDKQLGQSDVFKAKLGFEQTWPDTSNNGPDLYLNSSLYLPADAINIGDYRWAVNPQTANKGNGGQATIVGDNGTYYIDWMTNSTAGIPTLKITLDDRVILEQDMNDYINMLFAKYPPGASQTYTATLDDMCLKLETPEVNLLLVFSDVNISVNTQDDVVNYWLNLDSLYMNEK